MGKQQQQQYQKQQEQQQQALCGLRVVTLQPNP
jgi:hypothetical protein